MCGIFGGFVIESKIGPYDNRKSKNTTGMNFPAIVRKMTILARERGKDGLGIVFDTGQKVRRIRAIKPCDENGKFIPAVNKKIYDAGKADVLFIGNARAKPETEVDTDQRNIQPIFTANKYTGEYYAVAHNGAIAESFVRAQKQKHQFETNIDSEAILHYLKDQATISNTALEEIEGGFGFCYVHGKKFGAVTKRSICLATKYHPLYTMEVIVQFGNVISKFMYFHSLPEMKEIVLDELSKNLFGVNVKLIHYEFKQMEPYSFEYFDLTSTKTDGTLSNPTNHQCTQRVKGKFEPKYSYPTGKTFNKNKTIDSVLSLVATSSGIDSTTSLYMVTKMLNQMSKRKVLSGPNKVKAVHFMYGHRGQEAEKAAIQKIVSMMNKKFGGTEKDGPIELVLVDLQNIYQNVFAVENSQLIDTTSMIETGTQDGLKSTVAWVPVRNMMFSTIMSGMAETALLEQDFDKVYIVAGWNQLSEEGFYPDNSQLFVESMNRAAMFGTLVGHRIEQLPICQRILKCEQWALAKMFGFLDIFEYTVSCDIPIIKYKKSNKKDSPDEEMVVSEYFNCNGQCGSTLLSQWAAKRFKDIKDPRKFIEHPDCWVSPECDDMYDLPDVKPIELTEDIKKNIISRLILPPECPNNIFEGVKIEYNFS